MEIFRKGLGGGGRGRGWHLKPIITVEVVACGLEWSGTFVKVVLNNLFSVHNKLGWQNT